MDWIENVTLRIMYHILRDNVNVNPVVFFTFFIDIFYAGAYNQSITRK